MVHFAEYALLASNLAFRAPKYIKVSGDDAVPAGPLNTIEGAVSIGLSWSTTDAILFHDLGLKLEWQPNKPQNDFPVLI